jgi:hypothetical protein
LVDTLCIDDGFAHMAVEEAVCAADGEHDGEVRQVPNPLWHPVAEYDEVSPHHPYRDESASLFSAYVMCCTYCEQQSPSSIPLHVYENDPPQRPSGEIFNVGTAEEVHDPKVDWQPLEAT